MSTKKKVNSPPGSCSPSKSQLTSYNVLIIMRDFHETSVYGVNTFTDELCRTYSVMSLSPDSRWEDLLPLIWSKICCSFQIIKDDEQRDYMVGMKMCFTVGTARDIRCAVLRRDDTAFFGLLARQDITNIDLSINFTHKYERMTDHIKSLECSRTTKNLEKAELLETIKDLEKVDTRDTFEYLKVEASETTQLPKKNKRKSRSCILQ